MGGVENWLYNYFFINRLRSASKPLSIRHLFLNFKILAGLDVKALKAISNGMFSLEMHSLIPMIKQIGFPTQDLQILVHKHWHCELFLSLFLSCVLIIVVHTTLPFYTSVYYYLAYLVLSFVYTLASALVANNYP